MCIRYLLVKYNNIKNNKSMKYLHLFDTEGDYQTYKQNEYEEPFVGLSTHESGPVSGILVNVNGENIALDNQTNAHYNSYQNEYYYSFSSLNKECEITEVLSGGTSSGVSGYSYDIVVSGYTFSNESQEEDGRYIYSFGDYTGITQAEVTSIGEEINVEGIQYTPFVAGGYTFLYYQYNSAYRAYDFDNSEWLSVFVGTYGMPLPQVGDIVEIKDDADYREIKCYMFGNNPSVGDTVSVFYDTFEQFSYVSSYCKHSQEVDVTIVESPTDIRYESGDIVEIYYSEGEENEHVYFNKTYYEKLKEMPLTFEIVEGGNISWMIQTAPNSALSRTIEYKKNDGDWTEITSSTAETGSHIISVVEGDVLQFRGNNKYYAISGSSFYTCSTFKNSTAKFNLKGNIMSLIGKKSFANLTELPGTSDYRQISFFSFFRGCTGILNADGFVMPATNTFESCYSYMFANCTSLNSIKNLCLIAENGIYRCYSQMFKGCTSLVNGPKIVGAKGGVFGYEACDRMFEGCTSLINAPELPVTNLDQRVYYNMFNQCSSLTKLPALPAKNVNYYACYGSMFANCTSITTIPNNYLPATDLGFSCYDSMFKGCTGLTTIPSNLLPATTLEESCYNNMFQGCASLTTVPSNLLPATTLANMCYNYMFESCTNLTKAPDLPAPTLTGNCYTYMFRNCRNLNYVKCLATTKTASNTTDWVKNVSGSGTFVKDSSTSWYTGNSGIPSGWTIVNAE